MGNNAFHNMDAATQAAILDNEIDRLEYERDCLSEGHIVVKLTERQLWFLKCACEAKNAILPLSRFSLDPQIFLEDYGISQIDMQKEVNRLEVKLKAL